MENLKRGDIVWVAGPIDYPSDAITVGPFKVESVGGGQALPYVVLDSCSEVTDHRRSLSLRRAHGTPDEALAHARRVLCARASGLEEEARSLRATAGAEPRVLASVAETPPPC